MVPLTAGPIRSFASLFSWTDSDTHLSLPCVCAVNLRTRVKNRLNFATLSVVAAKESGGFGLGFLEVKDRKKADSCSSCAGFARRCKKNKGLDSEGNIELEAEILAFMENSEKPGVFPSKKDLIDAGRLDLVEAVLKQGGWLAMGWGLDGNGEEEEKEEKIWVQEDDNARDLDFNMDTKIDNGAFQEINGAWSTEVSSFTINSSPSLPPSTGRSLEAAVEEDDRGIEGILNRLERERNLNLGISLREKGNNNRALSSTFQNKSLPTSSMSRRDLLLVSLQKTVGDLQRTSKPVLNHSINLLGDSDDTLHVKMSATRADGLRNYLKPETWRTWSMRRAGFSDKEFEAAEISSSDLGGGDKYNGLADDDALEKNGGSVKYLNRIDESKSFKGEINHGHIESRLQHLQSELSSVLHSLRSHSDEVASSKDHENNPSDLEKLSDAWEFQENEIMDAQDELRSTRAKLAVLEGKMALAIIDARRIAGEKQKKIDHARRALRLLRTACIVWHNSASEVLLAGSFDGWATQRKMEKSKNGVFSLWLKLYPGKYEIKFIVDGQWKVDPLRPIVNSNGYENNLLIITEG